MFGMNPRLLAGLGMALLAVGLLAIFYLHDHQNEPGQWSGSGADIGVPAAAAPERGAPADVDYFLNEYNTTYQQLWIEARNRAWTAATQVTAENKAASKLAARALADFQGSARNVEKLRLFRGRLDLTADQDRQVEKAWQSAARFPGTNAEAVNSLHRALATLADTVAGHNFTLARQGEQAQPVTLLEINEMLATSRDPEVRLAAWQSGQQVGPLLKEGLVQLQERRNELARSMGYSSYFSLLAAPYELDGNDMIGFMDDLVVGLMPLYAQLHCWARHELAARYEVAEVPGLIPAHWLADPLGRHWESLAASTAVDSVWQDIQPQWVVEQAEGFFTSLGFGALPVSFWTRSDLFELEPGSSRVKSAAASAWHMDLDRDVRALLNVKADPRSYKESHHQLGRVYYYLAYSRPEVPILLRQPANPAFASAVGAFAELAACQPPYLQQIGLLPRDQQPDQVLVLLNQALSGPVVLLPYACGTLAHWEHELYERELPRHQFNTRWWQYVARYQGIAPPGQRGEDLCDAALSSVIFNPESDPVDLALGHVISHQLHRYICREILDQDVRTANYFGNPRVGRYLQSILELGAERDWNLIMRQATGEELSCDALLEYFAPLQEWLAQQNAGREVGF
jgi:peptidyl-dipeptidase A